MLAVGSVAKWVYIADAHGRNPKFRPVVILGLDDDAETAIVCAITSTQLAKIPDSYVELSWRADGNCPSRLEKRSWAVADWVVEDVPYADFDIVRVGRITPDEERELLAKLKG